MSGYKTFAFTGAGNIGKGLIEEFVKLKEAGTVQSVIALTRAESKTPTPAGAHAITVNYADPASLTAALHGVDVVVSTLAMSALGGPQHALAIAAKAAGVRLFVPSEYGADSFRYRGKPGPLGEKAPFIDALVELGLPYALFFTGSWSDFLLSPLAGWEVAKGKVTVGGTGDQPVSLTFLSDTVRYIIHALTALPASTLANKVFRIEGERRTFNEVIKEYQQETGKTLDVTYRPVSELEAALKANPADFIAFLYLEYENGEGTVGKLEEVDNALWPEWNPKKAVTALL